MAGIIKVIVSEDEGELDLKVDLAGASELERQTTLEVVSLYSQFLQSQGRCEGEPEVTIRKTP